MEEVLKGVGAAAGGATKQIPEIQQTLPPLEPESEGVGPVGYGIGLVILAVIAVGLYKNYQNNKK